MDYKVLQSRDVKQLENSVIDHLARGWDLVAGVSVWTYGPDNSSAVYTQTVVYYEKEGPKPLNVLVQNWPAVDQRLSVWQRLGQKISKLFG